MPTATEQATTPQSAEKPEGLTPSPVLSTDENIALPSGPDYRPQPPAKKKTIQDFMKVDPDLAKSLDSTQRIDNGTAYVSAKHNSSGPSVKFWQEQLKEWAINQGGELAEKFKNMQVTDSFATNPLFTALIKAFQAANGLAVDGIIGPRTFRAFAATYFEGAYGTGSFTTYTTVSIITQAEYEAILEESRKRRASYSGYAVNLPLPEAIDAKTILADPQKLAAFESFYNGRTLNGKPAPIAAKRFLELCAEYNFDPSLALAQAIQESHIGTNGDRPIRTKNIFNVGNTDSGSNQDMGAWENGMKEYLSLMTRAYGNNAETLLKNDFQRTDGGGRYASDQNYFNAIKGLVGEIRTALGAQVDYTEHFKEHGGSTAVLAAYHKGVAGYTYKLGGQRNGVPNTMDCSEYAVGYLLRVGAKLNGIPSTDGLVGLDQSNNVENFAYGSKPLQAGDVIVWGDGGGREGHCGVLGPEGIMFESTTTKAKSGPQVTRTLNSFLGGARGRQIRVLRPTEV